MLYCHILIYVMHSTFIRINSYSFTIKKQKYNYVFLAPLVH